MLSMYLCVFVFVAVLSLLSIMKPKLDKTSYMISFGVMTLFLGLRFGQGTDYPGYMCIYEFADMAFDPEFGFLAYYRNVHSEIGWKCLMVLFKATKVEFWVVTLLIALVTMWNIHLGISRFCLKYKTLTLLLLYPTIYLTYYFSGMRQGLAMTIFYGVLLGKLLDKKYIQYVIGVILISTIHSASLCYLIIPIIITINKKIFVFGIMISVLLSFAMTFSPTRELVKNIATTIGASSDYFTMYSISWLSLAERTIMLGIILLLVYQCRHNEKLMERIHPLLRIYIVGFLIYLCMMTNTFVSSRLAIMFKMAEVFLFPIIFEGLQNKLRNYCFIVLLSISTIMTYKNINSCVEQWNYFNGINGWNYPYVSIFNRQDILKYRKEFISGNKDFRESDYLN